MVLSDILSRQKSDNSNPHEIISISFSLRKVLYESCYKLGRIFPNQGWTNTWYKLEPNLNLAV